MQDPRPARVLRSLDARRAPFAPILFVLGLLLLAASAGAAPPRSAEGADDDGEQRVRATLVSTWREPGRAKLGVHFELDPGWHLYWRNPGDTGLAPRFDWQVEGAELGAMEWPLPQRFVDADIDSVSYGYEGDVLLALPVAFRPDQPPARAAVAIDFLVCAEQCIPGELELGSPFPAAPSPEQEARFAAWEARVPRPASDAGIVVEPIAASATDTELALALAVDACPETAACAAGAGSREGVFLPHRDPALERVSSRAAGGDVPGRFAVEVSAEILDAAAGDGLLRGVLLLEEEGRTLGVEVALPWRESARAAVLPVVGPAGGGAPTPAPQAEATAGAAGPVGALSGVGLLRAALLGFLGGLLLNLMPCVLPVLALKIFALTDLASRSRREVLWHVGGYTGGILLAMGALAGVVIGLRVAGSAVGWGFHLQEPAFVVAVCALLVAFALNLFGVFEINVDTTRLAGVGADSAGAMRSFFDGLLAVVLATPCSAPFLGTAVGFAFASSGFVITTIFASIGLGLAAPFALVAAMPAWGRLMPRSGPWMLHLRAGLGFALLASAVWLLWVLGRAAGSDAMAGALGLLVVVSLAAWTFGLLQRIGRPLPLPALLAVLVAAVVGGVGLVDFSAGAPTERSAVARADREDWDDARVQEVLAAGRPAFVYFTADWCITCKVNEARVLDDPSVEEAFRDLRIPVFRGDWTRRDETIRRALSKLGKAGVPAYALYQPHAPDEPWVLPELLSVSGLVSALEQASARADTGIRRADLAPEVAPGDRRS